MFRNNQDYKKYGLTTINCLISDGGMGDLLCSIMPINHIINNCPWINLLVWVPDYMVAFFKNVLPSKVIVRGFTEAKGKYDDKKPGITTSWNGQHTPMRVHPAKYSYHVLCDMDPSLTQLSYLKIKPTNIDKFNLPENIVILQGAYTEQVKTMPIDTFNKLNKYIIEKGYIPVYLGKTVNKSGVENIVYSAKIEKDYDLSLGINLIDKTTLLESASIINKSKLFIGMDGGLSHLTGFTDTKMVVGYTLASPQQLMPIRDNIQGKNVFPVIPSDDLKCKFCQSNMTLLYNHDFRTCLYDDFECTKQMTFDKFCDIIEKEGLL